MLIGLGANQVTVRRLLDAAEEKVDQPARLQAPDASKFLRKMEELWRQYRQVLLSAVREQAETVRQQVETVASGLKLLCEEAKDRADEIAGYFQDRLQRFVTSLIEWAIAQMPVQLTIGSRAMAITGIKLASEHRLGGSVHAALFQVAALVAEGTLKLEVSYEPDKQLGERP